MSEHISIPETARLVRRALAEAFPGVKFAVTSASYAGGGQVDVSWWDGPTPAEVRKVTWKFEGAWFDGQTDYKGGKIHRLDGREVHFCADWVELRRRLTRPFLVNALAFLRARDPGLPVVTIQDSWPAGSCTIGGQCVEVGSVQRALAEISGGAWLGKSALADRIDVLRTY